MPLAANLLAASAQEIQPTPTPDQSTDPQTEPPKPVPAEITEKEEEHVPSDLPDLLRALSESSKPKWSEYYRPPIKTRSDRNVGAIALGGVVADIHLATQGFDVRQVKNLGMEVEAHSRNLGIDEKIGGEVRVLSEAAGTEKWDDVRKAAANLEKKLKEELVKQRDTDLATLLEVGFWLRALEVASGIIQADTEAKDLSLCIGCPKRLEQMERKLQELGEETRKQPVVAEIEAEVGRLVRRWDDPGEGFNREDVDASHTKIRNLLRRIFENKVPKPPEEDKGGSS